MPNSSSSPYSQKQQQKKPQPRGPEVTQSMLLDRPSAWGNRGHLAEFAGKWHLRHETMKLSYPFSDGSRTWRLRSRASIQKAAVTIDCHWKNSSRAKHHWSCISPGHQSSIRNLGSSTDANPIQILCSRSINIKIVPIRALIETAIEHGFFSHRELGPRTRKERQRRRACMQDSLHEQSNFLLHSVRTHNRHPLHIPTMACWHGALSTSSFLDPADQQPWFQGNCSLHHDPLFSEPSLSQPQPKHWLTAGHTPSSIKRCSRQAVWQTFQLIHTA